MVDLLWGICHQRSRQHSTQSDRVPKEQSQPSGGCSLPRLKIILNRPVPMLFTGFTDDFTESDDGRGACGLNDADGLWPMVMELFTKMPVLMLKLMLALMLLLAMLPLMLHLSGQEATVEHRIACVVSMIVQYSCCIIALVISMPCVDYQRTI